MAELYDGRSMPLSNEDKIRAYQQKLINGDETTPIEQAMYGRDVVVKEINGYKLKPNHAYRAVSLQTYNEYLKRGFISSDEGDEYDEDMGNKGIDWFLGGICLKYGIKDNPGQIQVIMEVPASKEYFTPAHDNGCGQTNDPYVRHMKSSGYKKPIPIDFISIIIKRNYKNGKTIIEEPEQEKLFSHRSTQEKKEYQLIKQRNQMIAYQKKHQMENEDAKTLIKRNDRFFQKSGFINIVFISSITLIISSLFLVFINKVIG